MTGEIFESLSSVSVPLFEFNFRPGETPYFLRLFCVRLNLNLMDISRNNFQLYFSGSVEYDNFVYRKNVHSVESLCFKSLCFPVNHFIASILKSVKNLISVSKLYLLPNLMLLEPNAYVFYASGYRDI